VTAEPREGLPQTDRPQTRAVQTEDRQAHRRAIRRELVLTFGSGLLAGAALFAAFAPVPRGSDVGPVSLDEAAALSPQAQRGRLLVQVKGCVACHAVRGLAPAAQVGPDLTDLPSLAGARREGMSAELYVRESILAPQAFLVPGYQNLMPVLAIDAAELDAIVAFLLGR
jgi:mono/diheme cytochrome c family protein